MMSEITHVACCQSKQEETQWNCTTKLRLSFATEMGIP